MVLARGAPPHHQRMESALLPANQRREISDQFIEPWYAYATTVDTG